MTATTAPKPQPRPSFHYFTDDDRAALAAGYRHLADLIESGVAPVPTSPGMSFFVHGDGDEQPAAARDLMRALGGGKYEKEASAADSYLTLNGACGGVPVRIYVSRDAVCEKVPTGTVSVTEEIRVGEDTRPVETVTRDVETFEWVCSPLLAAAETANTVEVSA